MKILNRIVTFVLAAAIFPAMFTRVLIRFVEEPAGYLSGQNVLLEETLTLKELIEYVQNGTISPGSMFSADSTLPSDILDVKGWLFASVAFLVIAMLIAIVIMGCSLFTRAYKTVMGLSAGGALSCFIAMACFSKFAVPFVEGTRTISQLMPGSFFDGFAGQIAQYLSITGTGDVVVFQLGNAVITTVILFFAVAMWTLAYYVTLPAEEKALIKNPPVKEKKAKADKKADKKDSK